MGALNQISLCKLKVYCRLTELISSMIELNNIYSSGRANLIGSWYVSLQFVLCELGKTENGNNFLQV